MFFIWYNNILQGYCKNSSFPILETLYSLIFPSIYIRLEVWRINNVLAQLKGKIKKSLTNVANQPADQIIASNHSKLVSKLNKMKEKVLKAKMIHLKMLNLRLVFGNFPQSVVNIALLILATNSDRLKKYLVNINIVDKDQAPLILNQYFKYIITALVIKTIIGLVWIIIKNR